MVPSFNRAIACYRGKTGKPPVPGVSAAVTSDTIVISETTPGKTPKKPTVSSSPSTVTTKTPPPIAAAGKKRKRSSPFSPKYLTATRTEEWGQVPADFAATERVYQSGDSSKTLRELLGESVFGLFVTHEKLPMDTVKKLLKYTHLVRSQCVNFLENRKKGDQCEVIYVLHEYGDLDAAVNIADFLKSNTRFQQQSDRKKTTDHTTLPSGSLIHGWFLFPDRMKFSIKKNLLFPSRGLLLT